MKILILTPTYTGKADLEQRWPFFAACRELERAGHEVLGSGVLRGLLDHGRNLLFLGALEREQADLAIWLDDDIVWRQKSAFVELVAELERTGAALVSANLPRQDGKPCALLKNGLFASWDYCGEAGRVGLGLAVADLRWFRARWPMAPWFATQIRTSTHGLLIPPLGEDYFHSDGIRERGGVVRCYGVPGRNGDAARNEPAPWIAREGGQ